MAIVLTRNMEHPKRLGYGTTGNAAATLSNADLIGTVNGIGNFPRGPLYALLAATYLNQAAVDLACAQHLRITIYERDRGNATVAVSRFTCYPTIAANLITLVFNAPAANVHVADVFIEWVE